MDEIAALFTKKLLLLEGFHAFGHDVEFEAAGQGDDRGGGRLRSITNLCKGADPESLRFGADCGRFPISNDPDAYFPGVPLEALRSKLRTASPSAPAVGTPSSPTP